MLSGDKFPRPAFTFINRKDQLHVMPRSSELLIIENRRSASLRRFRVLEPPKNLPLGVAATEPLNGSNLEFDFMHLFYKKPNFTHIWNEYELRSEVLEKLAG